ncbi:probable jasmonic acid carboxyl methyltransferase 2 [Humulus lupulus]|uniref:probable jasmonic acid carboxyl methyltransferase 2 n=1 Tax=Humulus lupulus TaxID=3486 RepID=UPI002B40BE89|nr:probable jasmonic acid carboxyl methyltransferase 2 [Humulus lupulus]
MEVARVLHMNKGSGDTSYAQNSTVQSKILSIAKPLMDEGILKILKKSIPESMGIADLGCSAGPNSLAVIMEIVDVIHAGCRSLDGSFPELRLFLNDLFNNDFNNIFASLPTFYNQIRKDKGPGFGPCYIAAVPGSFYGRLFPTNSLHFIHSSSSLHWLSQVPKSLDGGDRERGLYINKGKLYLSKSSPQCVLDAYLNQFEEDFSLFLSSRGEEVVSEGRMVLSFMGRTSSDPTTEESCYQWELLATALMTMVSEGLIEEEKVDSFNAPYFAPCPEELKSVVEKEGSFVLESVESFAVDWDGGAVDYQQYTTVAELSRARGQRVAKNIRAVVESMLGSHFGTHILDDLFRRYQDIVADYLSNASTKYINLVISLRKKD